MTTTTTTNAKREIIIKIVGFAAILLSAAYFVAYVFLNS